MITDKMTYQEIAKEDIEDKKQRKNEAHKLLDCL